MLSVIAFILTFYCQFYEFAKMGKILSCFKHNNSVSVAPVIAHNRGGNNDAASKESYETLVAKMNARANMFVASSLIAGESMDVDQDSHGKRPKNPSPPKHAINHTSLDENESGTQVGKNRTRRKVRKLVLL